VTQSGAVSHKDFLRFQARVASLHVRRCLRSWTKAHGLLDDEVEMLVWPLVKLLNADAGTESVADLLQEQLASIDPVTRPETERLAKQLLAKPYETRLRY